MATFPKEISACKTCQAPICVSKIQLFRSLSEDQHRDILKSVVQTRLKKGEVFIHEGTPFSSLVIVSYGKLKAYTLNQHGKESMLYFYNVGDFFGQETLFSPQALSFSIEAIEDSTVCRVDGEMLRSLILANPHLAIQLIQELSTRLHDLEETVKTTQILSLEERLIGLLHQFEKDYGRVTKEGVELSLPMTQEDIAHRLGVSRESISRKLNALQDQHQLKLISRKRILLIKSNTW